MSGFQSKKTVPALLLIIACLCLTIGARPKDSGPDRVQKSDARRFVVVELFTSEGCSSCPPADAAVAALLQDYPENVFVLGFHVDYWNNLGWTDVYSSPAYSSRQQQYAAAFSIDGVYTPQVIVNGKTEFTGSEKQKLYASVAAELKLSSEWPLSIEAKINGRSVQVAYKSNPRADLVLNMALLQVKADDAVQRGENKGKLLHHVNVVRVFKTVAAGDGTTTLALPEGLAATNTKLVAFLQRNRNGGVLAATGISF